MLRDELRDTLKQALKEQDKCTLSTVRLILAALKDRDIAARGKGNDEGIGDDEILSMLQTMVRQRLESIAMFEQGGRVELAEAEREEIVVLERFLPRQLDEVEISEAVQRAIAETSSKTLKDMGKVMTMLREDHAGEMNFGKASVVVKEMLSAA